MTTNLSDQIIGIDHLAIRTDGLDLLTRLYSDALGFNIGPKGALPNSETSFRQVVFEGGEYLELLGPLERSGPGSLALRVENTERTMAMLRELGHTVTSPTPGTTKFDDVDDTPSTLWRAIGFMETAVPGGCVYFMDRDSDAHQTLYNKHPDLSPKSCASHPNSAIGIGAVWILTLDLEVGTLMLSEIGLNQAREIDLPKIGASAREFTIGNNTILLIQPYDINTFVEGAKSKSLESLEGIVGISVNVRKIDDASAVILEGTEMQFVQYAGHLGKSILLDPSLTGGLLLELYE